MILILVRFMQIGRARESWQIFHKALSRARPICMNRTKKRIISLLDANLFCISVIAFKSMLSKHHGIRFKSMQFHKMA